VHRWGVRPRELSNRHDAAGRAPVSRTGRSRGGDDDEPWPTITRTIPEAGDLVVETFGPDGSPLIFQDVAVDPSIDGACWGQEEDSDGASLIIGIPAGSHSVSFNPTGYDETIGIGRLEVAKDERVTLRLIASEVVCLPGGRSDPALAEHSDGNRRSPGRGVRSFHVLPDSLAR